jgi:predicted SnoaL-like aldol condensation-catalyzing enzyme
MIAKSTAAAALVPFLLVGTVAAQSSDGLEANKALADRYHMEVIQGKNLDLIDEIFVANPVIHYGSPDVTGRDKARQIAQVDYTYFPGGTDFKHDQVVAEGNLVAFRWTMTGIQESGEESLYTGIDIVRIENGRIAEMWIELNPVE